MHDDLGRFIDSLEFAEESADKQRRAFFENVDVYTYVKEIFEKISVSIDIETTLNIILDVLNDYFSPETIFVLTCEDSVILERNTGRLPRDYIRSLRQEGILQWVRQEGKQTIREFEDRKLAVAPLSIESDFQGYLVIVFFEVQVTPKLLEYIYITAQLLSVFISKMRIYRQLIAKSDNLEVQISETKELYDELRIVHQFVKEVGSIFAEQDLFAKLIAMCERAFEINKGLVLSLGEQEAVLQCQASTHEQYLGQCFQVSSLLNMFVPDKSVLNQKPAPEDFLSNALKLQTIFAAPVYLDNQLYALIVLSERKTNKPFSEQDERILLSLANQTGNCLQNIRLHEQLLEKKKIERDLELARDIQKSLLPEAAPIIQGIDMAALFRPAGQVGGDYYDFYQLDPDKSWFFLGDVAGKGMGAAMLMATFRSMLRAELRNAGHNPGQLLTDLNRLVCPDIYEGRFITFCSGFIDRQKELVLFANAGHHPLLLYRKGQGSIEEYSASDIPIGISGQVEYQMQNINLEPGDCILLFTDGVNEAMNRNKQQFGLDRVKEVFQKVQAENAGRIIQEIVQAVRDFAGEQPQYDDITLMVVKRN